MLGFLMTFMNVFFIKILRVGCYSNLYSVVEIKK
jgi:hypothetical protein